MSDGEEVLNDLFGRIEVERQSGSVNSESYWWNNFRAEMTFSAEQLKAVVEGAVASALAIQQEVFEQKLAELRGSLNNITVTAPETETYKDAEIRNNVQCTETLDIVKSLPDFDGKHETYVSWRKAAHTAYKIFQNFEGSSKHYQALGIIRNKIKGPADMVLASYDTALNFKAIINRLDFTYADKRPIYLIEQELSTLRQGNMTLLQYYDEVERKLTLLTNKTIMTYDGTLAASLNEKYRMDALRVFISGTKKALSDVLFSARPKDLPSALALAQEVESNHERYLFASNYARSVEDRAQKNEQKPQVKDRSSVLDGNISLQGKNPYFSKRQGPIVNGPGKLEPVQPMDVDQSSRFRQPTQYQNNHGQGKNLSNRWPVNFQNNQGQGQILKRPNSGTARFTGPKQQRVNHLIGDHSLNSNESYDRQAEVEATDAEDALTNYDEVNFLDKTPCSRT